LAIGFKEKDDFYICSNEVNYSHFEVTIKMIEKSIKREYGKEILSITKPSETDIKNGRKGVLKIREEKKKDIVDRENVLKKIQEDKEKRSKNFN
jgi:hypothetical protein